MSMFLLQVLWFLFVGLSQSYADSWQCPAKQTNSDMVKVSTLNFLAMDKYRGYKPAWMAMEPNYRSAIYGWSEESVRQRYLGNGNNYLDPYMYHERLRLLVEKYPNQFELWQIASTHFGFPVYAISIGDSTDTKKTAIMHIASLHGNEMIGVNYLLDAVESLLQGATTESVALLKNEFVLWFVPMANPDGNWLSMRRAHADTYGKKNGKNTDGTCECFAYEGVDLSANFPTHHSEKMNEIVVAESETKSLMNLLQRYNFVSMLSIHTGGNRWLTPPIATTNGPNKELVQSIGASVVQHDANMIAKQLSSSSDVREIVWFYEYRGFPAFALEYPSDIAPMSLPERESARGVVQNMITEFWNSMLEKSYVQGKVVNQKGEAIQAEIYIPQNNRTETIWPSSEKGEFALLWPKKEIVSVRIRAKGYLDAEKRIDLRTGRSDVTIVLQSVQ